MSASLIQVDKRPPNFGGNSSGKKTNYPNNSAANRLADYSQLIQFVATAYTSTTNSWPFVVSSFSDGCE